MTIFGAGPGLWEVVAYRVAALCSLVWQCRKRSSLSALLKTYLPLIFVLKTMQTGNTFGLREQNM